jgi:hypothetical protein
LGSLALSATRNTNPKTPRGRCAVVAEEARHVTILKDRIADYAAALPLADVAVEPGPEDHYTEGDRDTRAAYFLTLDTINFGSGWFPTLRKRDGGSGYYTVALGLKERFERYGQSTAAELSTISSAEIATTLDQDPCHELMAWFAEALQDLGGRLLRDFNGDFVTLVDAAGGSAVVLARLCRRDASGPSDGPLALILLG